VKAHVSPSVNHVCQCEGKSEVSARFRMRVRKADLVAVKGAQKNGMSWVERGGKTPPLSEKRGVTKGK